MSNKQFFVLPESPLSFEALIDAKGYFVDKTEYLKTVFTSSTKVQLFTRPRRFGKTLLMTMFESFLKINPEKPFDNSKQLELFKGTKILEDKEFCDKYMGQYPVIELSLKDVTGKTFEIAYKNFAKEVSDLAEKYRYLLNSAKLAKEDKDKLSKILDVSFLREFENSDYLTGSLSTIATALYKEYGKYPILLIDEYDVPLANASYHDIQNTKLYGDDKGFKADFHYNMVDLMKSFLGILKDQKTLTKIIITGCLKVAKNSLSSGVNNLKVNTVFSENEDYTGIIGFAKEETYKFLKDYDLEDCFPIVKEYYGGYKFYDKEIFNPVDVVNFVKNNFEQKRKGISSEIKTDTYWCDLVSNKDKQIKEKLDNLSGYATNIIQDLIDGKSITFQLNDSMNYDILSENSFDDFWSLLLHKGYLTVDWNATDALDNSSIRYNNICAKLPNLEIRDYLIKIFQSRFSSEFIKHNLHNKLVDALSCGNQKETYDIFFDMLQRYVSIRDTATKAPLENYYHGFINGIFTCCENLITDYHSNYESGYGYPDITFKSERNTKAVIIEIKAAPTGSDIVTLSETALSQIEDKNYSEPFMTNRMIQNIYAYGIAFAGKRCAVSVKKLK